MLRSLIAFVVHRRLVALCATLIIAIYGVYSYLHTAACTTAMDRVGSGAPSSIFPSWAWLKVCAIWAAIFRCPSRFRNPGMAPTTSSKDFRA